MMTVKMYAARMTNVYILIVTISVAVIIFVVDDCID